MHLHEGFLLGLSTGVVCLAYCGPVLVPYLMAEGKNISGNFLVVVLFLAGRLAAYALTGIFAGLAGNALMQPSGIRTVFFGIVYIIMAALLIAYGFHRFREICLGRRQTQIKKNDARRWPFLVPLSGGFATGLNFCPPFILAVARAVEQGGVADSVLFFLLFFTGTAVFFIPLPFIGFFRRQQVLRIIGKFAAVLAGIIYLFKGIIMLL